MCGIVGYIGEKIKSEVLVDGLKELEYRGYDSAGIGFLEDGELSVFKAVGKIENLASKLQNCDFKKRFGVGIGHTRWATHGKPTEINAHPHIASFSYIVHNGIIENYLELKNDLEKNGVKFSSQTDSEVIVHLFEEKYKRFEDSFLAFTKTIEELKGAFAILLISKTSEGSIFFAKHGTPLILGKKEDEIFFASSDAPLVGLAQEVIYLEDGDYGVVSKNRVDLFSKTIKKSLDFKKLHANKSSAQKDGFRFFMEKEIYEQHQVLLETMMGRVSEDNITFEEFDAGILVGVENIRICACGTSYHAAIVGSYLFERISKIKTSVEIASEFRYKEPILKESELFIVISQSGETADTLEALKMANRAGLKTLAICNVDNSSIVREASFSLLTRAGIEKGVASTKAFATQIMILWMISLFFAKCKGFFDYQNLKKELHTMLEAVSATKVDEKVHEKLKRLSKRYLHGHGFFFIGRDIFYPLALEGALKLKEISYLHAEGYPAGEMKHGPIALADSRLFTIALMPKNLLYEKIKSNVEELAARDATIAILSPQALDNIDDYIKTKDSDSYMVEFFEMMVILQLFSLEISIRLGNDVDMPRNLAKSVTVE